jgi:hypothetical protein
VGKSEGRGFEETVGAARLKSGKEEPNLPLLFVSSPSLLPY